MKNYMHEMTRISVKECEFCKRKIRVLSNETAQVISVQCSDCFDSNNKKREQDGAKIFKAGPGNNTG